MDKIEVKFGHRIKELRLKQNISQEEFGFFVAGYQRTIYQMLNVEQEMFH